MPAAPGTPLQDPLRDVRRAVRGGRFREAREAIAHLTEEVRTTTEGRLLSAMTAWRLGEYPRSRAGALEARDRFRASGDSDGEMRAENVAAAGALAVGDLPEAERGFQRALALADALGDDTMTAHCATNLGNVAYFLGRHQIALGLYRLAAATFERLGSWTGVAMAWVNAAVVWIEVGDLDPAHDAADRALAIAEREGNARMVGAALAVQADVLATDGDRRLADALGQRALQLARNEHDDPGEAEALRILATIARLAGDDTQATAYARDALQVATRVGDAWRRAEVLRELASCLEIAGERTEARERFGEAAVAFRTLGAEDRATAMEERALAQ